MPFLTTSEIVPRPLQRPEILNTLLERKNGVLPPKQNLFLYYNLIDKDLIQPIVNILKSLRINVYVNFPDHKPPNGHDPTGDKEILKNIIKADKVIFLSTPFMNGNKNYLTPDSFNGHLKDLNHTVVFPLTQSADQWETRSEYTDYGFITKKFSNINFPDDWQVESPNRKAISLKDWILNSNSK